MDLLAGLGTVLPGDRIVSGEEELGRHGGGVFTYHAPVRPDVVVYPENSDEVADVLRFANEHQFPIVPFGQGSSLEAQTIPVNGGISLDLGRMNLILEVRPGDFTARVQPGLTHGTLNAALAEHGLLFPVDPGWDASLGGMAGTNASGTNAVKYGACGTRSSASKSC
jgi:D-lactate dehydrogenase (cytochrome)